MTLDKIKWWQRLLSHFKEVHLATMAGESNTTLHVCLVQNRFQLSTENAIYSFDDLYLNFYKAFQRMDLPQNHSKLLLLGLGLGSIPYMLERKFERDYETTAVELDAAVIDLASRFTLPRLAQPLSIVQADAEKFVEGCQSTFDFLIVDLFIDDVVPSYFESVEGMKTLKNLMNEGAVLLVNRLYRNQRDQEATRAFYKHTFQEVFENYRHYDVGGNWIVRADA